MSTIPVANKHPKVLSIHNDERIDSYYWLNDRENPEVIDYLNRENAYREAGMAHTKAFQKALFEEIKGRIKETDESVPYRMNGYFYSTRFEEGKEYPIYCRRKGAIDAPEEILLEVNELAKEHEYYQVGGMKISHDNTLLAYGIDTLSRRQHTILIKNLITGEHFAESIPNTTANVVWAADDRSFFYVLNDPQTLRSYKVMQHYLGTDIAKDRLVFEEKEEAYTVDINLSRSKQYLLLESHSTVATEVRVLKATEPDAVPVVFHPRERMIEYSVDHADGLFYIVTNYEAKNFRLMTCSEENTSRAAWKELRAEQPSVLLEGIDLFKDFMVVHERNKGLSQICIVNQRTKESHFLDFGEESYYAYGATNAEYDTAIFRYGYTSMTTPNSTYDYDLDSRSKTLLKQQEVLGGYRSEDYQTKRIEAKAADGTLIPISLVYKKTTAINGTAPCLLYGYGSYGYSMDATFSSVRLSLLDRGFLFAIAHIRGGQEMGRYWYEEGKLLNKKNTFSDFICCGEHLLANGYAAPDKLMAMGGSAGGLLMGAVLNMRPDLWRAVVAQVPFVDVVTTMLDESIPLTTGEYDEWGNPNDKTYYDYIKSYSPYDNIEAKDYPALLVTTGLHDSQVQYWEPAKWVALLRERKTNDRALYLYCDMDTGHGGASGRFDRFKEVALEYAFLLDQLGMNN